jgi:hypothetical protein
LVIAPKFDRARLSGAVARECIDNGELALASMKSVNATLSVAGWNDQRISVSLVGDPLPRLDSDTSKALVPVLRSWIEACLASAGLVPIDAKSGDVHAAISTYVVLRAASTDNKKSQEYEFTSDGLRKKS